MKNSFWWLTILLSTKYLFCLFSCVWQQGLFDLSRYRLRSTRLQPFLISCLFFILPFGGTAQSQDSTKVSSSYFYEKQTTVLHTVGVENMAIKTDILAILDGDIPVIFEKRFSSRFTLNGGLSISFPYSVNKFPFTPVRDVSFFPFKMEQGGSVMIEPRLHSFYFLLGYTGLLARYRYCKSYSLIETGVTCGSSFNISGFVLEPTMLLNLYWRTRGLPNLYPNMQENEGRNGLAFSFRILVGHEL
jgi:hypothetical protein